MKLAGALKALEWAAFFGATVYGHVAMKFAVDGNRELWRAGLSFWGVSAVLSWCLSSVLWMSLLQKDSLFQATTISSLRYVLVVLAAWAVTRHAPGWQSALGSALIVAGILLARGQ